MSLYICNSYFKFTCDDPDLSTVYLPGPPNYQKAISISSYKASKVKNTFHTIKIASPQTQRAWNEGSDLRPPEARSAGHLQVFPDRSQNTPAFRGQKKKRAITLTCEQGAEGDRRKGTLSSCQPGFPRG